MLLAVPTQYVNHREFRVAQVQQRDGKRDYLLYLVTPVLDDVVITSQH